MGKVKRRELWWQLYRTSFPVWYLENFRPMDFCWHECTYERNIEAHSCNHCYHCCHRKAISITYTKRVFIALLIQHLKIMRTIVLSSVPVWLHHVFSHRVKTARVSGKKMLLKVKFVPWFALQSLSEKFLIIRNIQSGITINAHRSSFKVPFTYVFFWQI